METIGYHITPDAVVLPDKVSLYYYDDMIAESVTSTAIGTTHYVLFTQVPQNEIWIITQMSAFNVTRTGGAVLLQYYIPYLSAPFNLRVNTPAGAGEGNATTWTGMQPLKELWYPRVKFYGTVAGDQLVAQYSGYKIRLK